MLAVSVEEGDLIVMVLPPFVRLEIRSASRLHSFSRLFRFDSDSMRCSVVLMPLFLPKQLLAKKGSELTQIQDSGKPHCPALHAHNLRPFLWTTTLGMWFRAFEGDHLP